VRNVLFFWEIRAKRRIVKRDGGRKRRKKEPQASNFSHTSCTSVDAPPPEEQPPRRIGSPKNSGRKKPNLHKRGGGVGNKIDPPVQNFPKKCNLKKKIRQCPDFSEERKTVSGHHETTLSGEKSSWEIGMKTQKRRLIPWGQGGGSTTGSNLGA